MILAHAGKGGRFTFMASHTFGGPYEIHDTQAGGVIFRSEDRGFAERFLLQLTHASLQGT